MKGLAVVAGALAFLAARDVRAHDGFGYPDWIRLKDSTTVRCRILGVNEDGVDVIMAGGQGEETVTIDRDEIESLHRRSIPGGVGAPAARPAVPARSP